MDTQDSVGIDIAALPSGCQLQHAIYGDRGVLLLPAGATVTSGIKDILLGRGIEGVRIHQDDAADLFDRPAELLGSTA